MIKYKETNERHKMNKLVNVIKFKNIYIHSKYNSNNSNVFISVDGKNLIVQVVGTSSCLPFAHRIEWTDELLTIFVDKLPKGTMGFTDLSPAVSVLEFEKELPENFNINDIEIIFEELED